MFAGCKLHLLCNSVVMKVKAKLNLVWSLGGIASI